MLENGRPRRATMRCTLTPWMQTTESEEGALWFQLPCYELSKPCLAETRCRERVGLHCSCPITVPNCALLAGTAAPKPVSIFPAAGPIDSLPLSRIIARFFSWPDAIDGRRGGGIRSLVVVVHDLKNSSFFLPTFPLKYKLGFKASSSHLPIKSHQL